MSRKHLFKVKIIPLFKVKIENNLDKTAIKVSNQPDIPQKLDNRSRTEQVELNLQDQTRAAPTCGKPSQYRLNKSLFRSKISPLVYEAYMTCLRNIVTFSFYKLSAARLSLFRSDINRARTP